MDPKDLESEPHIADIVEKTKELSDHGDTWPAYTAGIIARTSERSPSFERLERRAESVLEWASVPLPDGAMLASMLTLTHQRTRAKNVTLEFICPKKLGEMVADERRIKQVVFHLLSNAINFTPPGGKVSLEATRRRGTISISVADTGIGIPAEELARVFDRFWRGGKAAGRIHGSGLGLSLVKSFVELHGGRVEIASEPEAGTRITCHLPLKAPAVREAG